MPQCVRSQQTCLSALRLPAWPADVAPAHDGDDEWAKATQRGIPRVATEKVTVQDVYLLAMQETPKRPQLSSCKPDTFEVESAQFAAITSASCFDSAHVVRAHRRKRDEVHLVAVLAEIAEPATSMNVASVAR